MGVEILMPALSPTMTEGKLARWLKQEGDAVKSGDVIAEIETDKATMEVEAVDEGTLTKILVPEGTEGVAVNSVDRRAGRRRRRRGQAGAAGHDADQPQQPRRRRRQPRGRRHAKQAEDQSRQARRARRGRRRAQAAAEPEKDWGPTKPITVREALRDAMAAEMRADDNVFLMGEEVAQYQGAYKISQGLLEEFGPQAGDRHADHRARLHRHGGRRGADRAEADRRVHDLQLLHAGDRPDHQLGRQDAVHVGRPARLPDRLPRPERRGRRASRRSTRQCYASWYAHVPGPEGAGALVGGRCQGAAARRHPRPEPGHLPRERDPLRPDLRRARPTRTSSCRSARPRSSAPASDVTIVAFSIMVGLALQAAEELAEAGHRGRGDQPALAAPARHRHHRGLGEEDQPPGDGRGGLALSPASAPRSRCR